VPGDSDERFQSDAEAVSEFESAERRAAAVAEQADNKVALSHGARLVVYVKAAKLFNALLSRMRLYASSGAATSTSSIDARPRSPKAWDTGVKRRFDELRARVEERVLSCCDQVKRFSELVSRDERDAPPPAERLMYEWALEESRAGAAADLLEQPERAARHYGAAADLFEQLLVEAAAAPRTESTAHDMALLENVLGRVAQRLEVLQAARGGQA
jgi:hypothetical protein